MPIAPCPLLLERAAVLTVGSLIVIVLRLEIPLFTSLCQALECACILERMRLSVVVLGHCGVKWRFIRSIAALLHHVFETLLKK